jgi:glycosyltransferase involved in cell wall biosynthesis
VSQPKLLLVVNVDWFFLSHRLPVALAARNAGFEVHVATSLTRPASELEAHGFTVHALDIDRRSASPWQAWRLVRTLRRLMRSVAPDVVHLVTIKPVLLGGLAARWVGVPRVIAAVSGLGYVFTATGWRAKARRRVVSSLYRLALARPGVSVIFQNADDQAMLQRHAGISDDQAVRIRGSGVDLEAWQARPLPTGVPVVLMAARLLADKGVREFVEAARQLRNRHSARFVLVGDVDPGNPASLQRDEVQGWVDEGVVEWWGHQLDMQAVISMAWLVVLPSYREGLPKVLIEAAACGRAVVTTNVPGCRDAIVRDCTGVLVAPRDAASLASGIESLLNDPKRMQGMAIAGRRWAEQVFDVRTVVVAHLALYQGRVTTS